MAKSGDDEIVPRRHVLLKIIGSILVIIGVFGCFMSISKYIEVSQLDFSSYYLKNEKEGRLNELGVLAFMCFEYIGLGIYAFFYKYTNRSKKAKFLRVLLVLGIIVFSDCVMRNFGSLGAGLSMFVIIVIFERLFPRAFNKEKFIKRNLK